MAAYGLLLIVLWGCLLPQLCSAQVAFELAAGAAQTRIYTPDATANGLRNARWSPSAELRIDFTLTPQVHIAGGLGYLRPGTQVKATACADIQRADYTLWTVPLLLRWQFGQGAWYGYAQAGFSTALLQADDLRPANPDCPPTLARLPAPSRVLFSIPAGGGLALRLGEDHYLFAEAMLLYGLTNLYRNPIDPPEPNSFHYSRTGRLLEQFTRATVLQVGYRYELSSKTGQ